MSKPLAGTKTEKNLWTAFAGESQARNKYDYFAGVARKEGFQQIAAIFEETASNEKAHAKIWFKELQGIDNTAENLKLPPAVNTTNGPICTTSSRRTPRKKLPRTSPLSSAVSALSKNNHEETLSEALKQRRNAESFRKERNRYVAVRECGNLVIGPRAPEICPVCSHPQAYFQLQETNFLFG